MEPGTMCEYIGQATAGDLEWMPSVLGVPFSAGNETTAIDTINALVASQPGGTLNHLNRMWVDGAGETHNDVLI